MESPLLNPGATTLYVTSKEEAGSASYYRKVQQVLKSNPCLQIVSIDDMQYLIEQGNIVCHVPLHKGIVLINNPYANSPNTFVLANDAAITIRQAKYHKILQIAGLLGASSYRISESSGYEYNRKLNSDLSVSTSRWGKTNLRLNRDNNFVQKVGIDIQGKCAGVGRISSDSYNEALSLARRTGLDSDPQISLLLISRCPDKENLQTQYRYHFCLTQEVNQSLDAAYSLNALSIFDFNANLQETIKKRTDITVDVNFEFPE